MYGAHSISLISLTYIENFLLFKFVDNHAIKFIITGLLIKLSCFELILSSKTTNMEWMTSTSRLNH